MAHRSRVLVPELVWQDGRFLRGQAIEFDPRSGRIDRVVPASDARGDTVTRLPGRALLPGFVNAHSHAFQRLMRGRTQWRLGDDNQDFWSWRQAMYAAALHLSPDDIFVASRLCFVEMVRAGITTVGEFHYLHNDPNGKPYADPFELVRRVIAAAEAVGLRIMLLNVAYVMNGIGREPSPEQRRFVTPDLDRYLMQTSALADAAKDNALVYVGAAPHSVRAVPRDWLRSIRGLAGGRLMPLHMHVAEQPAEVEACRAAYGLRPVELLDHEGLLDHRFTAVHAIHISDAEVLMLGRASATVCACPTTERDLGDGIIRAADLLGAGVDIATGSDSQTVIDPLEEIRLLEYHERLRRGRRLILAAPTETGSEEVAGVLLECATASGARALGLPAGRIAEGALADFVAIDLEHRCLAGWDDSSLGALITLSAPTEIVSDVWVNGVRQVQDGRHALEEEAARDFDRVTRTVFR